MRLRPVCCLLLFPLYVRYSISIIILYCIIKTHYSRFSVLKVQKVSDVPAHFSEINASSKCVSEFKVRRKKRMSYLPPSDRGTMCFRSLLKNPRIGAFKLPLILITGFRNYPQLLVHSIMQTCICLPVLLIYFGHFDSRTVCTSEVYKS